MHRVRSCTRVAPNSWGVVGFLGVCFEAVDEFVDAFHLSAEPKKQGKSSRCSIMVWMVVTLTCSVSRYSFMACSVCMAISSITPASAGVLVVSLVVVVKSMQASLNRCLSWLRMCVLLVPGASILLMKRGWWARGSVLRSLQRVSVWPWMPSVPEMTRMA